MQRERVNKSGQSEEFFIVESNKRLDDKGKLNEITADPRVLNGRRDQNPFQGDRSTKGSNGVHNDANSVRFERCAVATSGRTPPTALAISLS